MRNNEAEKKENKSLNQEKKRKRPGVSTTSSDEASSPVTFDEALGKEHTCERVTKRSRIAHLAAGETPGLESPPLKLHGLPPSLWQKIFCLLPPVFLGRLLRVSRGFHSLLTLESSGNVSDDHPSISSVSNSIWLASRKRYAAGLPDALPGQSELDMWRLIRGTTCQVCRTSKPLLTCDGLPDPWRPPLEGVRVIWPFSVRCCSSCLPVIAQQVSCQLLFVRLCVLTSAGIFSVILFCTLDFASCTTLRFPIRKRGLCPFIECQRLNTTTRCTSLQKLPQKWC